MPKLSSSKLIVRKSSAIKIDSDVVFEGKNYVDIRYMYKDKASGEFKPTRKGVMISHTEFRAIAKFFEELNADENHGSRMRKIRKAEKEV